MFCFMLNKVICICVCFRDQRNTIYSIKQKRNRCIYPVFLVRRTQSPMKKKMTAVTIMAIIASVRGLYNLNDTVPSSLSLSSVKERSRKKIPILIH